MVPTKHSLHDIIAVLGCLKTQGNMSSQYLLFLRQWSLLNTVINVKCWIQTITE